MARASKGGGSPDAVQEADRLRKKYEAIVTTTQVSKRARVRPATAPYSHSHALACAGACHGCVSQHGFARNGWVRERGHDPRCFHPLRRSHLYRHLVQHLRLVNRSKQLRCSSCSTVTSLHPCTTCRSTLKASTRPSACSAPSQRPVQHVAIRIPAENDPVRVRSAGRRSPCRCRPSAAVVWIQCMQGGPERVGAGAVVMRRCWCADGVQGDTPSAPSLASGVLAAKMARPAKRKATTPCGVFFLFLAQRVARRGHRVLGHHLS